ncbi:uncharacterized protein TNCV_2395041 [Trichonephila clavipes]|nr:uncharacterized protein TNCV_2395041 [Trichonephila clavipes]
MFFAATPHQVVLQHINFCIVSQSPSCQHGQQKGCQRGLYHQHFATFLLNRHYNGLNSNLGEGMDVCKCVVPLGHGGTLNRRRVASLLVRLAEGEERWKAINYPLHVLPQNWGGTEPKRAVTCVVLKTTACDMRASNSYHDEFQGPRYAARGLLETDHVILNNGQLTGTTLELAPPSPNYHTTPT